MVEIGEIQNFDCENINEKKIYVKLAFLNSTYTCVEFELSNMDLSKVQALQQKRTIAFVNHFVMTNVQFLNNFMKNCENKLMLFERKLEKVNAAMVLLESRLSSIPELNIPTSEVKPETDPVQKQTDSETPHTETNQLTEQTDTTETDKPDSSTISRPEYDRFVKMVQVGVPLQAVKLKLSLEGLDPGVLDQILHK